VLPRIYGNKKLGVQPRRGREELLPTGRYGNSMATALATMRILIFQGFVGHLLPLLPRIHKKK
jgi:topoisomerase IA-like protein